MREATLNAHHAALPALLEQVHALGREVVAPAAAEVDRDARFPREAFEALKAARLLSCYVPEELGGMGLSIQDLSKVCEALGGYCGSTAMIFAMHQIQVACIVHHALDSAFFRDYLRELSERQLLLASATTEIGIGGDVRSSLCAVEVKDGRFTLEKQAPVISYGEAADAILVTCRSSPEAGRNDQSQVLVRKEDCVLKPLSGWDTLGFRGTCSSGFTLTATGAAEQVLPVPYAEIHARTMHPFSHSVWSSLWLGIASEAVGRARAFVRAEARKTPGALPPSALRLAELDAVLFGFRASVQQTVGEYQQRLREERPEAFSSDFGWSLRVNNLKIASSQLIVDTVSRAMLICGIQGYRNDSKFSLGRQLRDAYGAALMVNNDRILGQSSAMQILQREG
ncbi:MAG TPA: acyl-CoA dehydrogenase family protein [Holophagaceae bacterium]|nr:acyl-CoA dehydrogenase family protein [Holophagaceae bacterium]